MFLCVETPHPSHTDPNTPHPSHTNPNLPHPSHTNPTTPHPSHTDTNTLDTGAVVLARAKRSTRDQHLQRLHRLQFALLRRTLQVCHPVVMGGGVEMVVLG